MPEARVVAAVREGVIRRARNHCEYCRCPQEYSPDPFAVEHIIPRASGGTDDPENLALSCMGCNGHKFTKRSAPDPINGRVVALFHPRRERWGDHFGWNEGFTRAIGLTSTGRATVSALQMNRPGVVNLRRVLAADGKHPPEEPAAETAGDT